MQTSSVTSLPSQPATRNDKSHCVVRYFDSTGRFREEHKKIDSHESRQHLMRFIIWCVNNNVEVRISNN